MINIAETFSNISAGVVIITILSVFIMIIFTENDDS